MVPYRATLDVPEDLVSWIENLVAARRSERGGASYTLTSWDQAVMTLVWLLKGATYEQLAADFGVGVATAHDYVNDTIDQLAALAPTLEQAIAAAGPDRRLLLDGTLIPTWRCAAETTEQNADPLYSGKHHRHGITTQGITDTHGELAFLGQARPGSTHDLTAARADGIIEAATAAGIETIADSGYQGAGGTVRTPVKRPRAKGHNGWEKKANSAHAKLRAPVERAFAVLKRFHILDQLRISPTAPPPCSTPSSPSSANDQHSHGCRPKKLNGDHCRLRRRRRRQLVPILQDAVEAPMFTCPAPR